MFPRVVPSLGWQSRGQRGHTLIAAHRHPPAPPARAANSPESQKPPTPPPPKKITWKRPHGTDLAQFLLFPLHHRNLWGQGGGPGTPKSVPAVPVGCPKPPNPSAPLEHGSSPGKSQIPAVFQSQDMKPFKKICSRSSCIPGWRVYIPPVPRDLRFASRKQSSLGGELLFGEWDPPARARSPRAAPQSRSTQSQGWIRPGTPMARETP